MEIIATIQDSGIRLLPYLHERETLSGHCIDRNESTFEAMPSGMLVMYTTKMRVRDMSGNHQAGSTSLPDCMAL